MDIHILWAIVMAFSAVMYTVFDGFDLGVGIIMPFISVENDRDVMVDSITPVWDGNETWIVLLGVGLFGGFPYAYSLLLPALYLPIIIMIISIALRGVSMEYRFITENHKKWWDRAFMGSSIVATFCQGLILGNLMEGIIDFQKVGQSIPPFHFLSFFTVLTGITLIVSYALIGSNWLNFKTTGTLQLKFKSISRRLVMIIVLLFALIIYGRFNLPIFNPRFGVFGLEYIVSVPSVIWYFLTALLLGGIFLSVKHGLDWLPFALNIVLVILSGVYIVSGFWPYIVPPLMTIYDAGSPLFGNTVLLYSSFIIVPIILSYLIYSYVIFKGKVTGKEDYDPQETVNVLFIQESRKVNGTRPIQRPIHLLWVYRLLIAVAGLFFFFLVLGFFGDISAIAGIVLFILVFIIGWGYYSKKQNI